MTPDQVPDGPLLVDTDVVSYWVTGADQGKRFGALVAGRELAISFATYGELLANAYRRGWGEHRQQDLRSRLRSLVVLPYNGDAVELWARMHAKLSGQLHKGGTNDLWTAACALATEPVLPIVTNNLNDFGAVARYLPELRLIHPDLE